MKRNAQFLGALGLACLTAGLPGCKSKEKAQAKIEEAKAAAGNAADKAANAAGKAVDAAGNAANKAADAAGNVAGKAGDAVQAAKDKVAALVPDLSLTGSPSEKLVTLLGGTVAALGKAKSPQEIADTLRGTLKKYDVSALRAEAKAAKGKGKGASAATKKAFKAQKEAYKKLITEAGKKHPEVVGPAAKEFAQAWGLN